MAALLLEIKEQGLHSLQGKLSCLRVLLLLAMATWGCGAGTIPSPEKQREGRYSGIGPPPHLPPTLTLGLLASCCASNSRDGRDPIGSLRLEKIPQVITPNPNPLPHAHSPCPSVGPQSH